MPSVVALNRIKNQFKMRCFTTSLEKFESSQKKPARCEAIGVSLEFLNFHIVIDRFVRLSFIIGKIDYNFS